MRVRNGLPTLAASLALLVAPTLSPADDASTPASVTIAGDAVSPAGTRTISGSVATARRCVADRRIQVLARYRKWTHRHVWGLGEWTPVARTRTTASGEFEAAIPAENLRYARVRVSRAFSGPPGHRHACAAALVDLAFQSSALSRRR